MRNNIFIYVFIVFIIALIIFAVYRLNNEEETKNGQGDASTSQEEQMETEIKLAVSNFDSINPILSNNKNIQDITKLIYEPLVNLTQDYKAEPCLATEWAKTSDTEYIVKLREGVKWSDGTAFTADDVLFTIDRLKEITSIYSYNVQYVIAVDIVDDYTVKITLDRNIPFFEYNLTFPILSAKYYEGEDFATSTKNSNPVGTGMFKISDAQPESITLAKNETWWNKNNKNAILQTIKVNINSSMAEVYNSFKMGNIDLVSTSNLNYTNYIGTIGYGIREYSGREHIFLALNTQNALLSNLEVRQAISYAIDKNNIISSVFGGNAYTSDFPLSYGSWLYDGTDTNSIYSQEQANQVLQDAGWTRGRTMWSKRINNRTQRISLNLMVKASDANRVSVANIIKQQLEAIGITININSLSDEQYNAAIANKGYDILLASSTVSASPNLTTYFGEGNLANYTNQEVSAIMQEVNNTTDENVLKEKYKRLKEIYKTDIPYISLYTNKNIVAYNTELAGEVASNWFYLFYNIENWYK